MNNVLMFEGLTDIQNHQFTGCYMGDQQAFDDIRQVVKLYLENNTEHDTKHAAECLRVMYNKGMGCEECLTMTDADLIDEFNKMERGEI